MLKHGIDRLAARAQLASNPFRQLRAIHPLHAVLSKLDQDLRTMPSCCPTGKVITGSLPSLDTRLLGRIGAALGTHRAGIDRQQPPAMEAFPLRAAAHARQGKRTSVVKGKRVPVRETPGGTRSPK